MVNMKRESFDDKIRFSELLEKEKKSYQLRKEKMRARDIVKGKGFFNKLRGRTFRSFP